MAGIAWQTTHVARTYKMPVPINAIKTFQQPLVGWTKAKRPDL